MEPSEPQVMTAENQQPQQKTTAASTAIRIAKEERRLLETGTTDDGSRTQEDRDLEEFGIDQAEEERPCTTLKDQPWAVSGIPYLEQEEEYSEEEQEEEHSKEEDSVESSCKDAKRVLWDPGVATEALSWDTIFPVSMMITDDVVDSQDEVRTTLACYGYRPPGWRERRQKGLTGCSKRGEPDSGKRRQQRKGESSMQCFECKSKGRTVGVSKRSWTLWKRRRRCVLMLEASREHPEDSD
jgi:hypothetical protein